MRQELAGCTIGAGDGIRIDSSSSLVAKIVASINRESLCQSNPVELAAL